MPRGRPWTEDELAELGHGLRSFIVTHGQVSNGGPLLERRCPPPCGRRFEPDNATHVRCSAACKQRAYRQRVRQAAT